MRQASDPGGDRIHDLRIKRSRLIEGNTPPCWVDGAKHKHNNPPIDPERRACSAPLPANSPPLGASSLGRTHGLAPRGTLFPSALPAAAPREATVKIGIVGHEAAKFTPYGEGQARLTIWSLLAPNTVCVSGRCHLGGVDVWAEEIAESLGRETDIWPPKVHSWEAGYKPRNLKIAQASDIVHVIVVDVLPPDWRGMQFKVCYHCARFGDVPDHVKSGACWTARQAMQLGKPAQWHIIPNAALQPAAAPVEREPRRGG